MFSGILTDNDLERDPGKIEAIEEMPKSQILDDAQHLNTFATYLSMFIYARALRRDEAVISFLK